MGDADKGGGDGGEKQASGLLRVVWFRQMLHRWQSSSTSPAAATGSSASSASDATQGTSTDRQGNSSAYGGTARVAVVEEPSPSPMAPDDPPPDVPCGCCAVYVGAERRRFVVPTAYLDMPVFARLLEKAEEEFGFDYHGAGITIPCDTEAFKYILVVMEAHRHGLVDDEGNPKERREEGPASETR